MKILRLEFNITEDVKEFCNRELALHETNIITHVMKEKGIFKNCDVKKFTRKGEVVKNYSTTIHTLRYDGIFIFRRFLNGLNGLQYRYEIEE